MIYRCSKQQEMYLYTRADFKIETLPQALCTRMGALAQVMTLSLHPQRKLARVDVLRVIEKLQQDGYFLQLPPDGQIAGNLYYGD